MIQLFFQKDNTIQTKSIYKCKQQNISNKLENILQKLNIQSSNQFVWETNKNRQKCVYNVKKKNC